MLSKQEIIERVLVENFCIHKRQYARQSIINSSIKKHADEYFATHELEEQATLWIPTKDFFAQDKGRIASRLREQGLVRDKFNINFFKNHDSTSPEEAGFWGAMKGSFIAVGLAIVLCFPVALLSAFFLEEYMAKSRFNSFLEINIANLTAVPSVIYGLMGLVVFVDIFDTGRSSLLTAVLTLAVLLLPFFIVIIRLALRNTHKHIRDAALSMGATTTQICFGVLLRASLPNIITGTTLSISRIIGETAPLLIIGMASFVGSIPQNIHDVATTMPIQIYLWSSLSCEFFAQKASLGILILLTILTLINFCANIIRNYYESKY
jgi:phosphate transport system permease protein